MSASEVKKAGAFVLAGGRSTRMGRDKALIMLGGETLVERALRSLGSVAAEVAIAGGAAELARFGRLVPDETPGLGPLSGIVHGLEAAPFEWNFFLAVDVPFVPDVVWQAMLGRVTEAGDDQTPVAVMARCSGDGSRDLQVQPLCAAYRRSAAARLRRELEEGRGKVVAAAQSAGAVLFVDFADPAWFSNINTPEELAVAEQNMLKGG